MEASYRFFGILPVAFEEVEGSNTLMPGCLASCMSSKGSHAEAG